MRVLGLIVPYHHEADAVRMTVSTAIATIVGCTVLMTVLGGVVGWALGRFAPDYYRVVFRISETDRFDPVSVGLGLGLSQGMIAGVVVGLALVALFVWRDIRSQQLEESRRLSERSH